MTENNNYSDKSTAHSKDDAQNKVSRGLSPKISGLGRLLAVPLIVLSSLTGCASLSTQGTQLLQGFAVSAASSGVSSYASQRARNAAGGQQVTINGGVQQNGQMVPRERNINEYYSCAFENKIPLMWICNNWVDGLTGKKNGMIEGDELVGHEKGGVDNPFNKYEPIQLGVYWGNLRGTGSLIVRNSFGENIYSRSFETSSDKVNFANLPSGLEEGKYSLERRIDQKFLASLNFVIEK